MPWASTDRTRGRRGPWRHPGPPTSASPWRGARRRPPAPRWHTGASDFRTGSRTSRRCGPTARRPSPNSSTSPACWAKDPQRPPLLYAVGSIDDLERTTPPGCEPAAELVERALAECAVALVLAGARRLLVAGGKTSGAVVTALGARTLGIGAQIAPGVAWARTEPGVAGSAEGIDLALKSGNFGGTDIFISAWDHLA
ncbi:nucleotide-binding domain containing protein [Streptomyces sp. HmicA12]|uniref:nucleotide-binding domain containing protein n=1 Tax=Streptomyces sp. HmicA12 TaxID=1156844 RepID=UPI001F433B93